MAINYGDLECSPWHIARQEAAADARYERISREEADDEDRLREYDIWQQEMRDLED